MKLALIVITDGREYVWDTLKSFHDTFNVDDFDFKIIIDDSLNLEFQDEIIDTYPDFILDSAVKERRGFGGAIQRAWSRIPEDVDYVFHLEDDFVFTKQPDIYSMISVLEAHPYLLQMALLRGSVNNEERAAGGVIQQFPDSYKEVEWNGLSWREHRRFFTTNPCVYSRSTVELGWPNGSNSEGIFGITQFEKDVNTKSAFWGGSDYGEAVEHIGHVRSGTGY